MPLQFNDEVGNPLPAGVQVTVFPAPTAHLPNLSMNSGPIGTDWTQAGGLCPNLYVKTGLSYVAFFFGRQGPLFAQPFAGGGSSTTIVPCMQYRSPSMTETNWAQLQTKTLWPKGNTVWWGDQYREPGGGVAWATAYGIASVMRWLDCNAQNQLQAARLQSSQDSDVDTWAADFLGPVGVRYLAETDPWYKARIYALLSKPNTTVAAIQAIASLFYAWLATQLGLGQSGGQALDVLGGLDVQGGLDITSITPSQGIVPTVYVWDRQTRPDLANQYNVNPNNNDGSVVIQVGLAYTVAWQLDNSFLDVNTFLINPNEFTLSDTAPDPRLGMLVNFKKAGGAWPRYLSADLTGS
jgi:hypothetical protein